MILAPVGLVQSILTTVGYIYMAKGRTDWMFRLGLITSPLLVASFVVGLPWGTEGVSISYAVCCLCSDPAVFATPFRSIELSLWAFVRRLAPTLGYSLVMLLGTIAMRIPIPADSNCPATVLAICVWRRG